MWYYCYTTQGVSHVRMWQPWPSVLSISCCRPTSVLDPSHLLFCLWLRSVLQQYCYSQVQRGCSSYQAVVSFFWLPSVLCVAPRSASSVWRVKKVSQSLERLLGCFTARANENPATSALKCRNNEAVLLCSVPWPFMGITLGHHSGAPGPLGSVAVTLSFYVASSGELGSEIIIWPNFNEV